MGDAQNTSCLNDRGYFYVKRSQKDADQIEADLEMHYNPVRRNGYEFYFFRFDNEDLRELQLHIVESELIQAVGRARLLRNDCTVTLLSNLPLPGAEFRYLKDQQDFARVA